MAGEPLRLIQLELAGPPPIEPGRYLLGSPRLVVVVNEPGGHPERRRRRRALRSRRPTEAGEHGSEPHERRARLTMVDPEPLEGGAEAAERWLERMLGSAEAAADELARGVRAINRVLAAHREATLDHTLADASAERALARRLGYASGDQAADGRWERAIELPGPTDASRREALRPRERVADLLAGRRPPQAAASAAIRARSDLEARRLGDAALQLELALRALPSPPAELAELRPRLEAIAAGALAAPPSAETEAELERGLALVERQLRRERAAAG